MSNPNKDIIETEILKIDDEAGGWDLYECVKGDTRVLRVIESHRAPYFEDRTDGILYSHACGYRD
jgi:hypothetical protein